MALTEHQQKLLGVAFGDQPGDSEIKRAVVELIRSILNPLSQAGGTVSGPLNIAGAAASVPEAADGAGVAGQIAWDSGFLYVCVDTDTWVRATLETWE